MRYEGLKLEAGKGRIVMRWYFCAAWILEARQHKRERKREGTTTYFVDTMEHKCVATGPVDIRQADCSLSLLRPIVGSSGPAEPPAGRALFPDDGTRDQRRVRGGGWKPGDKPDDSGPIANYARIAF